MSPNDALLLAVLVLLTYGAVYSVTRWCLHRLVAKGERTLRPYGTGEWGGLAEAPPQTPDTDASGMRCLGCGYYDDEPEAAQWCTGGAGAGHAFARVGPDGQTLEPETTKGAPR